jgi:preprotein translocase subunit SecG
LLTRTTAILAVGFFATSLLLSWMASVDRKPTTLIGPASQSVPAGGATPVAPPTSGGVLDTLKKADEQQKQAPTGPQAPQSQ